MSRIEGGVAIIVTAFTELRQDNGKQDIIITFHTTFARDRIFGYSIFKLVIYFYYYLFMYARTFTVLYFNTINYLLSYCILINISCLFVIVKFKINIKFNIIFIFHYKYESCKLIKPLQFSVN